MRCGIVECTMPSQIHEGELLRLMQFVDVVMTVMVGGLVWTGRCSLCQEKIEDYSIRILEVTLVFVPLDVGSTTLIKSPSASLHDCSVHNEDSGVGRYAYHQHGDLKHRVSSAQANQQKQILYRPLSADLTVT